MKPPIGLGLTNRHWHFSNRQWLGYLATYCVTFLQSRFICLAQNTSLLQVYKDIWRELVKKPFGAKTLLPSTPPIFIFSSVYFNCVHTSIDLCCPDLLCSTSTCENLPIPPEHVNFGAPQSLPAWQVLNWTRSLSSHAPSLTEWQHFPSRASVMSGHWKASNQWLDLQSLSWNPCLFSHPDTVTWGWAAVLIFWCDVNSFFSTLFFQFFFPTRHSHREGREIFLKYSDLSVA